MRRLIVLAVLIFLAAIPAQAQQATLNSPINRNAENNLRTETVYITRDGGGRWEVQVSVRDSGGVEIRRVVFSGPDAAHSGATALAFATAYDTARSGETGSIPRRLDFRTLGFLSDQGYFTTDFGTVTLVP